MTTRIEIVYSIPVLSMSVATFDNGDAQHLSYQTSVRLSAGAIAELAAQLGARQIAEEAPITLIFQEDDPEPILKPSPPPELPQPYDASQKRLK